MDKEKKDVQEVVTPAQSGDNKVENPSGKGDDKDKNFAELRSKLATAEAEKAAALQKLAAFESNSGDRSLSTEDEKEKGKSEKKETPDTLKIIFQRDMREATRQWNKKNKVSTEEWAEIKKKVSLTGEETVSEIQDKIDEAYHALPSVRERRDKELIEKGKKQAMSEFKDEELDLGGGGDVDLGGGSEPRFNPREKKFLQNFGIKPEDQKQIDKDGNPSDWKVLG